MTPQEKKETLRKGKANVSHSLNDDPVKMSKTDLEQSAKIRGYTDEEMLKLLKDGSQIADKDINYDDRESKILEHWEILRTNTPELYTDYRFSEDNIKTAINIANQFELSRDNLDVNIVSTIQSILSELGFYRLSDRLDKIVARLEYQYIDRLQKKLTPRGKNPHSQAMIERYEILEKKHTNDKNWTDGRIKDRVSAVLNESLGLKGKEKITRDKIRTALKNNKQSTCK